MKRSPRISPIWQAVIWIVVYILVFNVGEAISVGWGQPNSGTAPLLLLLATGLVLSLRARGRLGHYGVRAPQRTQWAAALYFAPLLVMALLQFVNGWDHRLTATDVGLVVATMIAVGFLEELLFRGFLYQAVLARHGVVMAVLVSGVTFGLGHIVNLARGYTGVEQLAQIVLAMAVGIVLALVVTLTRSILPGVVFHVLYNIGGSVTGGTMQTQLYLAAAVVLLCIAYSLFLVHQLRLHRANEPAVSGGGHDVDLVRT